MWLLAWEQVKCCPLGAEYGRLKLLRQALSSVPVLAVSASSRDKEEAQMVASGMCDYLKKPFNTEDLDRMIRKYVKITSLSD